MKLQNKKETELKNINELNKEMIARLEQTKTQQVDQLHTMYAQKMSVIAD